MQAKLRSLGILTEDLGTSLKFYRNSLKLRLLERVWNENGGEAVRLSDRSSKHPVELVLYSPPFDEHVRADFDRYGPGLYVQTFESDDIAAIEKSLQTRDVDYQRLVSKLPAASGISFRDPYGVVIEVFSPVHRSAGDSNPVNGIEYRLSHYCITCDDLTRGKDFYQQGLRMPHVGPERDDGLVFLASKTDLADTSGAMVPLELIGPPGLWEDDEAFLERRGPGLSYLCFSTTDFDGANAELINNGVERTLGPIDLEHTKIAFFKGPDNLDIEVLLPIFHT